MPNTSIANSEIIETECVLGKKIRTNQRYWQRIVDYKHSELKGRLDDVLETLNQADEVYQHLTNLDLFLYYNVINDHWICVIARHLNSDGFIVTAYVTTKAKRKGKLIWPKKTDK